MNFKYNFKKIFLIFCFIVFVCLTVFTDRVFSYDSNIAHPFLTQKAIEAFNKTAKSKITGQEISWIIQGAQEEDTPIRWMNHFYDPITNKGLFGFPTAKKWSSANIQQSLYIKAKGNKTWQKAIESYAKGDKQEALIALGYNLHLIEDMVVPAHTRNDPHTFGDSYEEWVKNNSEMNFSLSQPKIFNNLDEYFDSLANYSNKYFLSKDTINISKLKDKEYFILETKHGNFKCIKGEESHCLILIKKEFNKDKYFFDTPVHSDYYSLLAPKAISYGAGLIDLFFQEAEKEQQRIREKSWPEKIKDKFLNWEYAVESYKNLPSNIFSSNTVETTAGNISSAALSVIENPITAQDLLVPQKVEGGEEAGAGDIQSEAQEEVQVLSVEYLESDAFKSGTDAKSNNLSDNQQILESEQQFGVAYVIDGDTIILTSGEKVRYIGIDTPELGKPGQEDDECLAWAARLRNMELLSAGELKLVKDPAVDKDKYGRLLRYVYCGGVFVNKQLVREGLAEAFFCKPGWQECQVTADKQREQIIRQAVSGAEQYKRGLFSDVCKQEAVKKKNTSKKINKNRTIDKNLIIDNNNQDKEKRSVLNKQAPFFIFGGGSSSGNNTSQSGEQTEYEDGESLTASSSAFADADIKTDGNEEQLDQEGAKEDEEIAPLVVQFNLYDPISSSAIWTASATVGVNLEIENKEAVNSYFLSSSSTAPDLNSNNWASSSPTSFILPDGDGEKSVYLWLKYGENNISDTASTSIILDIITPVVTIEQRPGDFSNSTSTVFKFSANKKNAVFQCRLDNEDWHTCAASSIEYLNYTTTSSTISNLTEAKHGLAVRCIDEFGRISSSTIYNWLVDITAPTSTIANLEEEYNNIGFTVSWTGSDSVSATSSGIINYDAQYRIGEGEWIDWITVATSTSNVFNIASEAGKNIYFRSRARDKAGNVGEWSDKAQTKIVIGAADHVVISEIYNGPVLVLSSGSRVYYYNDWIELYNPTDKDIDLKGYRIEKAKTAKDPSIVMRIGDAADGIYPGGIIIAAHGYYLIVNNIATHEIINKADAIGTKSKVIWKSANYTLYLAKDTVSSDDDPDIIDKIGFGERAEYYEGSGPALKIPKEKSIERKAASSSTAKLMAVGGVHQYWGNGYDTDDNSNDFVVRDNPNPQNSHSFAEPRNGGLNLQGEIIYEEDFAGGTSDDWLETSDLGAVWQVAGDVYYFKINEKELKGASIYQNGFSWQDYIFSFDAELNDGVDRYVYFRYQDSDNYYQVGLRGY